jgi:hypothetical protein
VEFSDGWVALALIVAAIGWWYVKPRIPSGKYRRGSEKQFQPTQPPAPQGPQAPPGIPMPTMEPPKGRYGPEYLTGQIKAESEDALQLIRENFGPDGVEAVTATFKKQGRVPEWPTLYAMAADFLGALRWYTKAVSPHYTDRWLKPGLQSEPRQTITGVIDNYRKLPPSEDRDQALKILGFYLQNMAIAGHLAGAAWLIAIVALDRKVAKDKAAGLA